MSDTVEITFRQLFLFLKKYAPVSNASRNIIKPHLLFQNPFVPRRLSLSVLNKAGRGTQGKRVCFSKGRRGNLAFFPRITYNLNKIAWAFVTSLSFNSTRSKLLGFILTSNGGFAYIQTSAAHTYFSTLLGTLPRNPYLRELGYSYLVLQQLTTMSELSLLEQIPGRGAVYSRSSGTAALLIRFNYLKQLAIVKLPSGVFKTFSIYSMAMIGAVSFREQKRTISTKKGDHYLKAKKPQVRGVAKNPVDHPHGGRTKAIKYPRTPWGRTTKFK